MKHLLLQEYVRLLLKEDGDMGNDLGGLGGFAASDSPYGVSFTGGEDLRNIFISPFLDVFKTAAGKGKELSQKAQTLGKVAFEATMTTLIPNLADSYGNIFKKEQQEIARLKQEYSQVYSENFKALLDTDVQVMAFLYSPAAYLTAGFFRKSPVVAADLLSVMTGGRIDSWLEKIKDKFNLGQTSNGSKHTYDEGIVYGDRRVDIAEADDVAPQKKDVAEVLANPKAINAAMNSQFTRQASSAAKKAVQTALTRAYNEARDILQAKNLNDIERATGKKIDRSELSKLPEDERMQAEMGVLKAAKASMKEFFVKNLTTQRDAAVKEGVPQHAPYVDAYNKVIERIKGL